MTGNSHPLFWLRVGWERACPSSAYAWLYQCPSPCKPTAHTVSLRLFPSPTHPHTLSPSTPLNVGLLVSFLFSISAVVVHVTQDDVGDVPPPADIPRSRISVWNPERVNRSSSHFCSYNRVGDVSNDVLTYIRRVRRCQKPVNPPRYACHQTIVHSAICANTAICRKPKRPRSPPRARRTPARQSGLCLPTCSSLKIGERGSRLRTPMPALVCASFSENPL